MKFSLIIPVYNVEHYVERCLRTCMNQNVPESEYEIIVINDGSTDNSLDVVKRISKESSNIVVFSQANSGLSNARNRGLSMAKGEFIWFIDSDDYISENCLNDLYEQLKQHDLDILMCNMINTDGHVVYKREDDDKLETSNVIDGKTHLLSMNNNFCAVKNICKHSFLKMYNLSFMEGIFHEDSEYTPKLFYSAKKIMKSENVFYFVYANPESITRSVNPKKAFDLIEVMKSLVLFRNINVKEKKLKIVFNNFVGVALNSALSNLNNMSIADSNEFFLRLKKNRKLLFALFKSNNIKYKLEAFLFIISPKIFRYAYSVFFNIKN